MSKIFCTLNVDLQGEEFLRICSGRKEFVRNWCRIFSTPILAVEIFLSNFMQSKKLHHALSKKFCRAKKPVSKKFCRNSGVLPHLSPQPQVIFSSQRSACSSLFCTLVQRHISCNHYINLFLECAKLQRSCRQRMNVAEQKYLLRFQK